MNQIFIVNLTKKYKKKTIIKNISLTISGRRLAHRQRRER